MPSYRALSRTLGLRPLALGLFALLAGACDSLLETDLAFPTTARVVVTGTADEPLELVVSSSFERYVDDQNQVQIRLLAADTIAVTPDYDENFGLLDTRLGGTGVVVRLRNHSETAAVVTLRVYLDGSSVYDQEASLVDAALEYRRSFFF